MHAHNHCTVPRSLRLFFHTFAFTLSFLVNASVRFDVDSLDYGRRDVRR